MKNLKFLFLGAFVLFSCDKENDEPKEEISGAGESKNVSIEITGDVQENFTAHGVLLEGPSPVFEGKHVAAFEFNENNNPTKSRLMFTIDRYSEDEITVSKGNLYINDSYHAGGDLDSWGAGATYYDENNNATIFSDVQSGVVIINGISPNKIRGSFLIEIKSQDGQKEIRLDGDFDIPRETL